MLHCTQRLRTTGFASERLKYGCFSLEQAERIFTATPFIHRICQPTFYPPNTISIEMLTRDKLLSLILHYKDTRSYTRPPPFRVISNKPLSPADR